MDGSKWYWDYYSGKRSADDARQIKKMATISRTCNGRFRKWLGLR